MSDEITGEIVAPVVTEAPEVKPESAQEPAEPQASETESEAGEKETPAEKTFTQTELNEILEKKTAKLARLRDQERSKREQLEREVAKASIPRDEGRPRQEHFADADTYAEAVADWKLGLRDREERVVQQHKSASTFDSKAADLRAELEETEGFDAVKFQKLPISDAMAAAIVDSDVGVKLAQHLYTNPAEAARIAELSPARQAAEIGKLEAKLSTAPQISKAPAPITPIGKGNAVTSKSVEAMSHDEYRAMRKAQGARWAQ